MEFQKALRKYKNIIDKNLSDFFDGKIRDIDNGFLKTSYSFLGEYVLRGGKRIRPIATIMAYKSVKSNNEKKVYLPALSTELFHSSSLVHDDIMDEDSSRRSDPSMHNLFESYFLKNFKDFRYKGPIFSKESKRFSVSMAIIQGNILYSLAESCLAESDFSKNITAKALEISNNAYRTVNHGQMFDILMPLKQNLSEKDYIDMAANKTAKLIEAAIEIGALLGNAAPRQRKALKDYAINAALAFQIQDDIIDVSLKKGRALGSDIRKGKTTLLTINAFSKADKKQKKFLLKVIGNENCPEEDIQKAVEILNETGSIGYAKKTALEKIKKAKSCLRDASLKKEGLEFFMDFADFMVNRDA